MHCPRLDELPAPPPGRSGWPWTVATPALPGTAPGGARWPVISIVVASLNQGRYIEETLRSILLQGYPELEVVLIDGGSDAATLAQIEKYAPWLTHWVSEPDRGQSHAWNKGLARATGALFNLFGTDDILLPGALASVAAAHLDKPERIVAGDVIRFWEGSAKREVHFPEELDQHAYAQWWAMEHHGQPGLFYPRRHLAAAGPVDETLHYSMDYEFTLRYLGVCALSLLHCPVAVIRNHAECKSVKGGDYCVWECMQVSKAYQRKFPDIAVEADRQAAGILFGFGFRRLLCGQPEAWKFMREGLRRDPFRAVYWLFPGWFQRKWLKLRAP